MDKKQIFANIANELVGCSEKTDVFGSKVFILGDIPEKKHKNACKALNVPEGEKVLVLFDDTAFGSAKDGMLFTTWGIRYKVMNDNWTVSWEALHQDGYKETKVGIVKDYLALLLPRYKGDYSISRGMVLQIATVDLALMKLFIKLGTEVLGNKESTISSVQEFLESVRGYITEMTEEQERSDAEAQEMLNKAGAFAKGIFQGAVKNWANDMNTPHVWQCTRCGSMIETIGTPGGNCPGNQRNHMWVKIK